MLHHLHADTKDGTPLVGGRVSDLALEASCPRTEIAGLRDHGHLVLVIGDGFGNFILDVLRVEGLITNATQGGSGLVKLTLLHLITRGLRKQSETTSEDGSPQDWTAIGIR